MVVVIVGAAEVAAVLAVSAVAAVPPVVVSSSLVVVIPVAMGLMPMVAGDVSGLSVPEGGGGSYDIPCTVGVGDGASHLCVGGSLDGVVFGVLVGWVAWGGTPGGGGGVGLCPGGVI